MRIVISLMVWAVMGSNIAWAGELEDGIAAYMRQDYRIAATYFRSAAQRGNVSAQSKLGMMYSSGQGVPQDYVESVKWHQLAAQQGDASAQYNLGVMYYRGQGVAQDYVESVKWYRLAAQQGYASAQSNLGVMYFSGQGVAQDYVRAHLWFNLASVSGDADAIKNRDMVVTHMTTQQIAEAQAMARTCEHEKMKGCN